MGIDDLTLLGIMQKNAEGGDLKANGIGRENFVQELRKLQMGGKAEIQLLGLNQENNGLAETMRGAGRIEIKAEIVNELGDVGLEIVFEEGGKRMPVVVLANEIRFDNNDSREGFTEVLLPTDPASGIFGLRMRFDKRLGF